MSNLINVALTQHPPSVATYHGLKELDCHVGGGPVHSTKALLHLLLSLTTSVVPEGCKIVGT